MNYLFLDESGSMTVEHSDTNGFFVIAIVNVYDRKKLKRAFKRFISKKKSELKSMDKDNKMFNGENFIELKGSSLIPAFKIEFAEYLMKNNLFQVLYIRVDNSRLIDGKLYECKARAFNYILKCALTFYGHQNKIKNDKCLLQIDERNTKTYSINSLEEYLWLDLVIEKQIYQDIEVSYFHSEDNIGIQVADFFSNLYFSYLHNPVYYKNIIDKLRSNDIILDNFIFPI
jgi:hypothetical protein